MSKVIKLSDEVADALDSLRERKEGWDSMLRRHFGLPSRFGKPQPLAEYFVVAAEKPVICRTKAEANGEAILLAVRRGQKKSDRKAKDPVIRVREVPA